MHIERDRDDVVLNSFGNELNGLKVRLLYDLLAEVVAKLVDHHISEDGKHVVHHADQKVRLGPRSHFLLQHSAPSLVEAVEV